MKDLGLRVTWKDDPVPPVPPVAPTPSPAPSFASSATAINDIPHPSAGAPRPASTFMRPASRLGESSRLVASSPLNPTFKVPLKFTSRPDSPFLHKQGPGQAILTTQFTAGTTVPLPVVSSIPAVVPYMPHERVESFKQPQSQTNSIYVSQIEREVSASDIPSILHIF